MMKNVERRGEIRRKTFKVSLDGRAAWLSGRGGLLAPREPCGKAITKPSSSYFAPPENSSREKS